jgi:hypothetical protein
MLTLKILIDLDNHANRPEVQDAFLKGRGWSIRYSDTRKTTADGLPYS